MLNIKGAFVVYGPGKQPLPVLLAATAVDLLIARMDVVGIDKAVEYTFGHGYTSALPCTEDCMTFLALNHDDPVLKAICARIALRQPLGDDEGGLKVEAQADKPKPRKPRGGVMRQAPVAEVQS